MKKNKEQMKKTAVRWMAILLVVLMAGSALFSSVISMIHFH